MNNYITVLILGSFTLLVTISTVFLIDQGVEIENRESKYLMLKAEWDKPIEEKIADLQDSNPKLDYCTALWYSMTTDKMVELFVEKCGEDWRP